MNFSFCQRSGEVIGAVQVEVYFKNYKKKLVTGGGEKYPPEYRGNGYDNFSPEWKLREVLQQQGAGAAPLGQVAVGGWKKERSSSVGQWSGSIRPLEPNWGPAGNPEPPPPGGGGNNWGEEIKVSSHGWVGGGQAPRKIEETYRVTSGGGGVGRSTGNWIPGASGWAKGSSGPEGPPSFAYQGGGHGGYHDFDGNRVSGQSLKVQSDFQPWRGGGGQEQEGLQGWGTGKGLSSNWEYGRPVEPHPQAPYTPRDPDVKDSINSDPRWGSRGPSWGFRDPPFGSESRDPSWATPNANWNKVASGSLSVTSVYGPDPPSPPKESSWGSKWPARGPPPHQYPYYGGSGRREGVGCRDLGCSSPAGFPQGPSQWGPPSAGPPSGGGGWGGYQNREAPPRQPPSWRPSGGGGGGDPYRQPPPGAPSGFKPGHGQGYPGGGQGGYPSHGGPPSGHGYPSQGYPPQGRPPPSQGFAPSSGGYDCPPPTPPPRGCPPNGPVMPPQSPMYPPQGRPPPSQGFPPSSGGYDCPPPAAPPRGCPPSNQGGPGASGYPPGGQGGPGASGYPPGGQGPGAGGPGASGYPPSGGQQFPDQPRKYNGHSGVGATLDFPGLNAYAHDTSNHGSFNHCNNNTDQHAHSSTVMPTSTSPP